MDWSLCLQKLFVYNCKVGCTAQWLGRRSLAGGLSLISDHFVGKVSATGQPTRPTQPPIPPGSVNE